LDKHVDTAIYLRIRRCLPLPATGTYEPEIRMSGETPRGTGEEAETIAVVRCCGTVYLGLWWWPPWDSNPEPADSESVGEVQVRASQGP
jgi:hypothetical protein